MNTLNVDELVRLAWEAREKAYAPYSGFLVGAVAVTETGNIYTGSNIENISYGLTVCAERNALFRGVHEGARQFDMVVVAGSGKGFTFPCGACLQVMAEFKVKQIIITNEKREWRQYTLEELLPCAFQSLT